MYIGYVSCVTIGGNMSDWLEVKHGAHCPPGGSFLHATVWNIHQPSDLELKASRFGDCIDDIAAACPSLADDGT